METEDYYPYSKTEKAYKPSKLTEKKLPAQRIISPSKQSKIIEVDDSKMKKIPGGVSKISKTELEPIKQTDTPMQTKKATPSQVVEQKQPAKTGWSFFNLFRGPNNTSSNNPPQIKHLDPKLAKNNISRANDIMKPKMPVIRENEAMQGGYDYTKEMTKSSTKKARHSVKGMTEEESTRDGEYEKTIQFSKYSGSKEQETTLNEASFEMKPMKEFLSESPTKESKEAYASEEMETEGIYNLRLNKESSTPKQMGFEEKSAQKTAVGITPQKTASAKVEVKGFGTQPQPIKLLTEGLKTKEPSNIKGLSGPKYKSEQDGSKTLPSGNFFKEADRMQIAQQSPANMVPQRPIGHQNLQELPKQRGSQYSAKTIPNKTSQNMAQKMEQSSKPGYSLTTEATSNLHSGQIISKDKFFEEVTAIEKVSSDEQNTSFEILDQDFYKNMPSLSRQSSIPSQPDSSNLGSNSFLQGDEHNVLADFQNFAYPTHNQERIDAVWQKNDLLQELNNTHNTQKPSYSHRSKMPEPSFTQHKMNLSNNYMRPPLHPESDNSFSSSGSAKSKNKSLSKVTYYANRANFNMDSLETLRSGYTYQTGKSEIIDNNANDRDSQDGRYSDGTILSNYTVSQQVSRHIDQNLSREFINEEYRGTIQKMSYLGGGSEAKVYLIKHPETGKLAALKLYTVSKSNTESYETVKNEFEMVRCVPHENIIEYYILYRPKILELDSCVEYGIIMEYMRGGTLEKYIEQSFADIGLKQKKEYMRQVLKGLELLHWHGIIYRDLKPGNILLSEDHKNIKLTDFGISKKVNTSELLQQTTIGTPWYMAPEIINSEPYSFKADIWSAGCCFMHLLTGKRPFHDSTAVQVLAQVAQGKGPYDDTDESTKDSLYSEKHLCEFMKSCLSYDKTRRPTASALLKHPFLTDAPVVQNFEEAD